MNVLLVTPDDALRDRLEGVLREHHHAVAVASTAEEGLRRLEDFAPDVVTVDLALEVGDGLGLLSRLRSREPAPEVLAWLGGLTADSTLEALAALPGERPLAGGDRAGSGADEGRRTALGPPSVAAQASTAPAGAASPASTASLAPSVPATEASPEPPANGAGPGGAASEPGSPAEPLTAQRTIAFDVGEPRTLGTGVTTHSGVAEDVELVGRGSAFLELQRFIARVGPSDSAVLLRGETGTGKEMVARALHRRSARRNQPLVVLDCAALTESLLQSELFGHEKGAFTGATHLKRGLFELANGGTAFLDEIGDLGPGVQASLLRVLETSSFRRVGGTKELTVDVRIIAATHRPLERMMKTGAFREDLYFRLNTIHLTLEPLRRRREEIPCLVEHLVRRHDARTGGTHRVTPAAMALLCAHDWPGNIRELRHVVERALVMAEGAELGPAELPPELRRRGAPGQLATTETPSTLAELEAQHMARVLAQVGGHRAQAARLLGISERSLYRKIIEYQLDTPSHRGHRP